MRAETTNAQSARLRTALAQPDAARAHREPAGALHERGPVATLQPR